MEHYHKLPHELGLTPKQRGMYFKLGAQIQSSRRRGQVDANYSHELALAALESTGWKSLRAARAMCSVMRYWG